MSEGTGSDGGLPETGGILCPHCGLLQLAAPECARCGIVFAKLAGPPAASPAGPTPTAAAQAPHSAGPVPPTPSTTPRRSAPVFRVSRTAGAGVWPGYWVLLGLSLVGAVVFWPGRASRALAVRGDAAAIADEAPQGSAAPPAAGTAPPPASPAASAASTPSAPAVRELPPVRAPFSWYEGAQGYRKGVEEARLDRRPLGIYLFADDCDACRRFSEGPLRSSEVADYLRGVVKVRLDPGRGAEERAIADQLGIADLPALLLVPPGGGSPRRIAAAGARSLRLATPAELIAELQRAIAPGG
jgi:hypothetical protein